MVSLRNGVSWRTTRWIRRAPVLTAALVLFSSPGAAEAKWSHTTTFRHSRSTSIRVVEPQGFTVEVAERRDSIPAVFNLASANAYVWVKVTSNDGQIWRQKVEVRERRETVLKVLYTPEQSKAAPSKQAARKFIGSITNASHRCRRRARGAYRFDFMLDGRQVYSRALNSNKRLSNVELLEGSYDVRIFQHQRGRYFYKTTIKTRIGRDGWSVSYGCGR